MTEREKLAKFEETWKPTVYYADHGWMLQVEWNCSLFMQHSEITTRNHYCNIQLITSQNKSERTFLFQRDDSEATLSEILEAAGKYALKKAAAYMQEKASCLMADAKAYETAAVKLSRLMIEAEAQHA